MISLKRRNIVIGKIRKYKKVTITEKVLRKSLESQYHKKNGFYSLLLQNSTRTQAYVHC